MRQGKEQKTTQGKYQVATMQGKEQVIAMQGEYQA
jgi:hypothetical protein